MSDDQIKPWYTRPGAMEVQFQPDQKEVMPAADPTDTVVCNDAPPHSRARTQPADDNARLSRVLLKAEKLTASRLADMRSEAEQGRCSSFRMLWLLDAFDSLLRLLDEANADERKKLLTILQDQKPQWDQLPKAKLCTRAG